MPRITQKSTKARPRAAAKTSGKNSSRKTTIRTVRTVSEADIRQKAYEIYMRRGGDHGHDLEDWFEAERELN